MQIISRVKLVVAASLLASAAFAQTAEPKTADLVYKNILQLKGTPAEQLVPAMQFIASSLGVDCAFCHVQGKPEADDKPQKKTARKMMAMMDAINKDNFNGQRQVTCYSCHHGIERPAGMPPVLESDAAPPAPAAAPPAAAASAAGADAIVEKYVAALGGADAIRKISSRAQKGVILAGGSETPIDVLTKAPNRRVTISHGQTDSYTAFDGTAGWMGNTGRPAREMTSLESEASALDAEFYLPLRLKEIFLQLRAGRPETLGGVVCDTLTGTRPGKPPVRMSFDRSTGLLVRVIRYTETPVGRNPTQIDYADYRAVDGVKMPFRWTLARPNGRFTIQIKQAQVNVPIDDAKFVRPAGEVK